MFDKQQKEALETYANNLIIYFNKLAPEDYPWSAMILEFGYITVINQQEMAGRIKMICDLLGHGTELSMMQQDNRLVAFIQVRK